MDLANPAIMLGGSRRFQRRVLDLMLEQRRGLARVLGAALASTALGVVAPYASRIALDEALPNASPNLLLVVAGAALLVTVHRAWATWTQGLAAAWLQARVERGALTEAMRALLRSDLVYLREKDSGWTLATLRGAGAFATTYVSSVTTLLARGASAIVYFAIVADFSPQVAALVLVASICVSLLSYLLAGVEADRIKAELDQGSLEQSRLHVLVNTLASLRGLFASERLGREWVAHVRERGHASLGAARAGAYRAFATSVGEQLLGTGITVWATIQCFGASLSIGSMIFLLSIASGLSSSVLSVAGVAVGLRALRPNVDRVEELLEGESRSQPVPSEVVQTDNCIRLEGVQFRYSAGSGCVFDEYDWSLERGKFVHLQSASGTGKTTLLRMIAGLLTPGRGRVSVFGVDATQARALVLYVPQHCRLFEASIRENLEILSGASLAEIRRVARLTGLDELLRRLPMGEETPVSSGGQNLSAGQRQLIVLTAAFSTTRPVLLLDEATSQIDAETRRRCQWPPLLAGRTVIRVEHG
jgi:ABC-type bacteriocin/lantibiotic exporter with double-glycine peptidase domain